MRRRAFLGSGLALAALGRPALSAEAAGELLVVDSVGSRLLVLDGRTFATVARVPLEPRPREIALAPGGSMAYVAIYGTGLYGDNPAPGREIIAIDTATRKVAKRIGLGPFVGPHAMAVAPDGRLWTTCEREGALLLIDPSARTRARTIPAVVRLGVKGAHWLAMTPDGEKLYVASGSNGLLSVVSATGHSLEREVKMPGGLGALAIAPDGRRLFVASLDRATLWAVDVREDRLVREIQLTAPASRLLAIPDGSGLMVAQESAGTLEVLEVPSLRRRGVAKIGTTPSGMAVSPDGRVGYVAAWADGRIAQVDLRSLRVMRTIAAKDGPDGLALARSA